MKIIFFSNSCWSVHNFRTNLIKKLIEKHEIIILAPFDGYQKKLKNIGCKVINIDIENNKVSFLSDLFLIIKIFKILSNFKKNSILLNFTIKPLIFGTLVSRFFKIPCICMITGLGTVFIKENFLTYFVLFLYKIAFKGVFHIFFQNKDDKKIFINQKIVSSNNFSLIPGSGVDLKKFNYHEYKKNKFTTFLLVARLLKEKGVLEYIEVGKLIKKKKLKIKLNLVGSFVNYNKSTIDKKIIFDAHKNKEINYLGFTNNVRFQIKKADCMVLPSYREGTPRSLLEGAAMGRPIIATNAPGCREVVFEKKNGFFCKIKDSKSLFNSITKFHSLSFVKKKKMSIKSHIIASTFFDEKKVIYAYMVEINKILKNETK